MFIEVEILVEDIEKSDNDEAMGTNLHEDKFFFRRGMINKDSINGWVWDAEDTLMLFLNGSTPFVKATDKLVKILNKL